MTKDKNNLTAVEGEEWFCLSLHEVSYSFGIPEETVFEIIEEGIITVQKNDQNELYFDHEALRRIRTVLQLNRDLRVNLAGAALVLELLNEIDRLNALIK